MKRLVIASALWLALSLTLWSAGFAGASDARAAPAANPPGHGASSAPASANLSPQEVVRAQRLFLEIRCAACNNEPIAQSNADLAADMRELVLTRIAEGKTDREIRREFVEAYGQFILFRPLWNAQTMLIWTFPFAFFGGISIFVLRGLWRSGKGKNKLSFAHDPPAHAPQKQSDADPALEEFRRRLKAYKPD